MALFKPHTGTVFPYKTIFNFPSGDELAITTKHVTRLRYKASTVPMDKAMEAVGLAHSILIGKGLRCADNFKVTYARERTLDDKTFVYRGAAVSHSSPEAPLNTQLFRSMMVKKTVKVRDCSCGDHHSELNEWQPPCWSDGTSDNVKDQDHFYALVYDNYKAVLVSPGLECIYIKQDILVPDEHQLPKLPAVTCISVDCAQPEEEEATEAASAEDKLKCRQKRAASQCMKKKKAVAAPEGSDDEGDEDEEDYAGPTQPKKTTYKKKPLKKITTTTINMD
jgi:hypothetical protein